MLPVNNHTTERYIDIVHLFNIYTIKSLHFMFKNKKMILTVLTEDQ